MEKLKFILTGETTVGKTSLITQYINNIFNGNSKQTTGIDKTLKVLKINEIELEIEILDTPGQDRYKNVNKIFMKNTDIALIVYDITNRKSFEKLNFWINLVKEVNENRNLIIGIAANKSDLYENSEVNKEEGEEYAKKINALYFETSATEHENIENLFQEMTKAYIDKYGINNKNNKLINDNNLSINNNSGNQTNNYNKENIDDQYKLIENNNEKPSSFCDKSFQLCNII